jgi:hypothetical protein
MPLSAFTVNQIGLCLRAYTLFLYNRMKPISCGLCLLAYTVKPYQTLFLALYQSGLLPYLTEEIFSKNLYRS